MNFTYLLWGLVLLLMAFIIYRRIRQFRAMEKDGSMAEHPALIILSDQNFDEIVASGLSLVDFWAPWCGPCRIVGPIISTLASDYEGRMKVGKLNVDENPLTAAKYGIRSIPTIMIFKDGKLVEKVVGAKPKPVLEKMIQKYLS